MSDFVSGATAADLRPGQMKRVMVDRRAGEQRLLGE